MEKQPLECLFNTIQALTSFLEQFDFYDSLFDARLFIYSIQNQATIASNVLDMANE